MRIFTASRLLLTVLAVQSVSCGVSKSTISTKAVPSRQATSDNSTTPVPSNPPIQGQQQAPGQPAPGVPSPLQSSPPSSGDANPLIKEGLADSVFVCVPASTAIAGKVAHGTCAVAKDNTCPSGFTAVETFPNAARNLATMAIPNSTYGQQYTGAALKWPVLTNTCTLADDPGQRCLPTPVSGNVNLSTGYSSGMCLPSTAGTCPVGFTKSASLELFDKELSYQGCATYNPAPRP